MLAIPITDPGLKSAILTHMIERIDAGGIDELLAAGVSPTFIDDLRRRPARDIGHAARQHICKVEVSIDTSKIFYCFRQIDQTRRDEEIKEYFIRHGASATLLRNLFRLSKSAVVELRHALGVDQQAPAGRARLPMEEVRDEIHAVWLAVQKSAPDVPTREQFYQLHQRLSEHPPNTLWAAIEEFNALAAKP